MGTKLHLQLEDIYSDPYGFTYSEVAETIGEEQADKLYHNLYSGPNGKKQSTIRIKEVFRGPDTQKYAFELSDGYCIETVSIKRKTGTTVCVSTMIGCPVGCIFCASGKNGFIRNLTPSEIVQQVVLVSGKVNRIVFMGMGEPLFNYDNVIKAIHILRDRKGLNFPTDGITISTSGPLPQMKKIREEHLKIQLTLSLHATNQRTRNYIMPHMKGYDIEEVVQSTLSYSERHNRTVIIPYKLADKDEPAGFDFIFVWEDDGRWCWEKVFYTSDDPFGSLQDGAKRLYDLIESSEFDAKLSPKVHQLISDYVKGGRPE